MLNFYRDLSSLTVRQLQEERALFRAEAERLRVSTPWETAKRARVSIRLFTIGDALRLPVLQVAA